MSDNFPLSREGRDTLKGHVKFFDSIASLYQREDLPLRIKVADLETRTERLVRPDGDVEVHYVYPIDDNSRVADGRIYLRDRFVLSPDEKDVKSFKREFTYNNQGGPLWQDWLDLLQKLAYPSPVQVKDFVAGVVPTHGRPMTDPLLDRLRTQLKYLTEAGDAVRLWLPDYQVKAADPQNHYILQQKDGQAELTISMAVDRDSKPENGRIVFHDRFVWDLQTNRLLSFNRDWEAAPEAVDNPLIGSVVEKLNALPDPAATVAEAYLRELLPELLPKSAAPTGPESASRRSFSGRWKARLQESRELGVGIHQGLLTMEVVALEQLEKRYEQSQGWLYGGNKIKLEKEKQLLQSVFSKAEGNLELGRSPFEILSSLALRGEELKFRRRLLEDRLLQRINDAAQERHPGMRGKAFLQIARSDLWGKEELPGSAIWLAESLQNFPEVSQEALGFVNSLQGRGSPPQKFEMLLSHFAGEITKPSMLVAMAGAGLIGPASELMALRWLGRFGLPGRLGSAALGIGGEAAAFTTLHKVVESASTDPGKIFSNWHQETLSSLLLFGALRIVHGADQAVWSLLASESKLRHGKLLRGFLRPAVTVSTMSQVNRLSRNWGLQPEMDQGFTSDFFDAGVMYLQALSGFNLASRMTAGFLPTRIASLKWHQENLRREQAERKWLQNTKTLISDEITTVETGPLGQKPLRVFGPIPSDVVLFDLAEATEPVYLSLEPGVEKSLDPYFFGNDQGLVRLGKNPQGHLWLLDSRQLRPQRRQNIFHTMIGDYNFIKDLPLQRNGQTFPTGQWVPLLHGDVLSFLGKSLGIHRPNQREYIAALTSLNAYRQGEVMKILEAAKKFDDLSTQLSAAFPLEAPPLLIALQDVLDGKEPLHSLPMELGIQTKAEGWIKKTLKRQQAEGFNPSSYFLRKALHDPRWGKLEGNYHSARAWVWSRDQVAKAKDLSELRYAIASSPFERIGAFEVAALAQRIGGLEQRSENAVQSLPAEAGIRQKVRDLFEQETFSKFWGKNFLEVAAPVEDRSLLRNMEEIQRAKQRLFEKISNGNGIRGGFKTFRPDELRDALYQVIERGKTCTLLTEAEGLRDEARKFQVFVADIAEKLFYKEMQEHLDPFTGERVYRENPESRYRLALHLLNSRSGRPPRGLPSVKEAADVISIVQRHLDPTVPADFNSAQTVLRHHLDTASYQGRTMLRLAGPEQKALILDTYFGNYRRRDMAAATAFQVATLMGQAGMYREVGITYNILGDQMRATLSLGDLSFVAASGGEEIFLLHTHPEEYLTPKGRLMGAGGRSGVDNEASGATMAFDGVEEINPDTRNVLPSVQDIRIFAEAARSYWKYGYPERFGNTPLFDVQTRVFKNWVINSWGASEINFELTEKGALQRVLIRYTFAEDRFFKDVGYLGSIAQLKAMSAELHVPVEFEKLDSRTFADRLPFKIHSFF